MKRIMWFLSVSALVLLVSCGGGVSNSGSSQTSESQLSYPDLTIQALLSDAQLQTPSPPSSVMLPNPVEFQWLKDHHYPLRSLVYDKDFSDLSFLKAELLGKRIVQLGESSHGVREFDLMKVRLIKYMHEELGFNVLAFESGMLPCHWQNADMPTSTLTPAEMTKQCIFGVWQTEELAELFRYIKSTHLTSNPLKITGFDIQLSGTGDNVNSLLTWLLPLTNAVDANSNTVVSNSLGKIYFALNNGNRSANFIPEVGAPVIAILKQGAERNTLNRRHDYETAIIAFKMLQYRLDYNYDISRDSLNQNSREKGMADTLSSIAEQVYPDEKIIVWAHNAHIATQVPYFKGVLPMGGYLKNKWNDQLFTIGLFMLRGSNVVDFRTRVSEQVKSPGSGSLEELSYSLRLAATYLPIEKNNQASAGDDWQHRSILFRSWGSVDHVAPLSSNYNAVIMIDHSTIPKYLF